jgi:hypothetical protein
MRTEKNLKDIILKAQCCLADMGYKALKQEMFLKNDSSRIHKNITFLNALINLINKHYNIIYVLNDTSTCLTNDQLEDVIQQISLICDNCNCCTDREDILKDI